ncbi:MAG: hypothetical protein IPJ95_01155 [Gemmatimonadetes bacterium]|nr:hypothetical protein [Gemmatimonadota bacterium]
MRQFEERLTRLDLLATQQESGNQQAQGSVGQKDVVRGRIEEDYLQHRCGSRGRRSVRSGVPGGLPDAEPAAQPGGVRGRVRAMLAAAASRQQVFIAEGMAETFVADLEALLAEYLGVMEQQVLAAAQRVGAVAELPEVAKELMGLVRRLDGINRKRWQKSPELLAAWLSAKDIGWPHPKPEVAPGEPGSGESAA